MSREKGAVISSENSLYLSTAKIVITLDRWDVISDVLTIHDVRLEVDYLNPKSPTATENTQSLSGSLEGHANLAGLQASTKASYPVGPAEIVFFYNKTLDFAIFSIGQAKLVLNPPIGGATSLQWKLTADWAFGPDGGESNFDILITKVESVCVLDLLYWFVCFHVRSVVVDVCY